MLVAIEDISGQIGHNYMRDKYVKTFQTICILKCLHCFSQLQLTLLSRWQGGNILKRTGCRGF